MKRYIDNLYFGNHSWKNDWAELEIIIFLYFFDHPHQVLKFLYRSRWKAEIFTVNINWVNNLIICTLVIRVGKMTEQSWNIFNFLHFLWPSTHRLTISNPFKMKSWNCKEWSDTLIICTSVIIVGKWLSRAGDVRICCIFTIYTRSYHFWTDRTDGKQKFSQHM